MPKSFLITNKRYKGDSLIQKWSCDAVIQTAAEVVLQGEEDPDHTVRPQPESDNQAPSPTPTPDTSSEHSGSNSKENGVDVEVACWNDEIPRDCVLRECSIITDLTSSQIRPSETPDSGSDYGSEPVDFSIKARSIPQYDISPAYTNSPPSDVSATYRNSPPCDVSPVYGNSPPCDVSPACDVSPTYAISPPCDVSPPCDISPPYFPTLFSSVIDERTPVSQSAFKLHTAYHDNVAGDFMYKNNLRQLDYSLNALVEKAWSEISVGDDHNCPECGKRYSTSSNLARHRQTHRSVSDKKARKCPHCEKVYVSMPAFSMHVRTHNQGCECPYCGKRFSRPWLLQGHIRTHTGEKPFTCQQCGKAFADKSNLRAHVQTHSTDKPFACARCGKAFALKSYLYKHEESSCMRGQHQRLSQQFHGHNKDMRGPSITAL